jgi:methyl-accepting chemotaxis protein
MEEEFELLPLHPLRKLERRIERLEEEIKKSSHTEFLREIVDIIKITQVMIDEIVKSNEALKLEISKLYPKLDSLTVQLQELLNFIKMSAFQESLGAEAFRPLMKKMDEMISIMKEISNTSRQTAEKIEGLERRIKKEETVQRVPAIQLPPQLPPLQEKKEGLIMLKKE